MTLIVTVFLLLCVANGAPLVMKRLFGTRGNHPLDGGMKLTDGRFLFGPSKTIRGIVSSLIVTATIGLVTGVPFLVGSAAAAGAMGGDLASSFLKRRLGRETSGRATGIDQVPESLFPCVLLSAWLPLSVVDIALLVAVFFASEVLASRALFAIGLRDRPY